MIRRAYFTVVFSLCACLCNAQWTRSDIEHLDQVLNFIDNSIDALEESNHSDFYELTQSIQTLGYGQYLYDIQGLVDTIKNNSSSTLSTVGSFKSKFDTFYDEYHHSLVQYSSTVPRGLTSYNNVNLTWDPYTYRSLTAITNSVKKTEDYNKQQVQLQKEILSALTNYTHNSNSVGTFTNFLSGITLVGSLIDGRRTAEYGDGVDLVDSYFDYVSNGDFGYALEDYGLWRLFVYLYLSTLDTTMIIPSALSPTQLQTLKNYWVSSLGKYSASQGFIGHLYQQQYGTSYLTTNSFEVKDSIIKYIWPSISNLNSRIVSSFGETPLSDVVSDDGTYHTNAPVVQTFLSSILPSGFSTPPSFTNPPLIALNQDSLDSEKTDFETKNEQLTAYISPVVASINSDLSSAVQSLTSQTFGESWTINGWSGFSFGGNQIGGFSSLAMNRPSYMPSFAFLGWCIRIVIYFSFIFAVVRRYVNLNREFESNSSGSDDFL